MTLLYTSRFEVALGALARYDEWFVQHAHDLIGVGFDRVHGYRSSIAPRALSNVYELPGLHVFGPEYQRARERDELGRAVRPLLSPAELGVFAPVRAAAGAQVRFDSAVGAPGLCVLDLHHATDEVLHWCIAPGLAELAGVGRSVTLYETVAAPVSPAEPGRLRIVVACPTADDAFTLSDHAAAAVDDRFGSAAAAAPRLAVDVLTHRVTYPLHA